MDDVPADSRGAAGTIIETDPPSGGDPAWSFLTMMSKGNTQMATMMTSKGRVTVPKTVREFHGVGPGSTINFELIAPR